MKVNQTSLYFLWPQPVEPRRRLRQDNGTSPTSKLLVDKNGNGLEDGSVSLRKENCGSSLWVWETSNRKRKKTAKCLTVSKLDFVLCMYVLSFQGLTNKKCLPVCEVRRKQYR